MSAPPPTRRSRYADVSRDANEPLLVTYIQKLGGQVHLGPPLDGWLLFQGLWTPFEIKVPEVEGLKHEYKSSQLRFFRWCQEHHGPYLVLRTLDDVLQALNSKPLRIPKT